MDPFFKGTGKTGTGQVSFTRKNLSEPFHFLSEPFHFFRSCKRALNLMSCSLGMKCPKLKNILIKEIVQEVPNTFFLLNTKLMIVLNFELQQKCQKQRHYVPTEDFKCFSSIFKITKKGYLTIILFSTVQNQAKHQIKTTSCP